MERSSHRGAVPIHAGAQEPVVTVEIGGRGRLGDAPARSGPSDKAPKAPPTQPPDRLERATGLAFLAFVTTLPLEWMTVTSAGGGFIKPFHLTALVFIGLCVARWRPRRLIAPVLRRHAAVYAAYFALLAVVFSGGLAYKDPYLPRTIVIRQLFYVSTSVVVAGFLFLVIGRRPQRRLAWSGLVTAGVLVVALSVALGAQHTNAITVLGDAISQRNPDIISYRLLRSAFRTDTELADVAANLRHKVFAGLLVAVFLGLTCSAIFDRRHRLRSVLLFGGSAVGFSLVVLSLSRSTILCLLLTLLVFVARVFVRNRAKPAQAAALVLATVLALGVAASPVGGLLYNRFATTTSYESRVTAAGPSFLDAFEGAALAGTQRSRVEQSPHNFILHSWLSGGIAAAVAATVALFSFFRIWLREARRYVTGRPGWVLPVRQLWYLGIGIIPLVRSFTSGNQFHMVEWTAIGLFVGLTLANERTAAIVASTMESRHATRSARDGSNGDGDGA